MFKIYRSLVVLMFGVFAAGASAEVQKVSNTSYGVQIEAPTEAKTSMGMTVMVGGLTQATAVSDDGTTFSQWCRATFALGDDGNPIAGGGSCTIISEAGDLLFVWFGGSTWGVIGGTGEYAGATGGGTTTQVSQGADGRSFINKSMGEIVTK
jgi:hypothetical protein